MSNIDTNELKETIQAQGAASTAALEWAGTYLKGEDLAKVRDTLIGGRVNMNRIAGALEVNPAAAVFGQSQVGKSYLVQNLLKDSSGTLRVVTDSQGGTSDFILDLNPSGGGGESTSLITRFTVNAPDTGSADYPLAVRIFTPTDVVLTFVDSYFSDVDKHNFPDRDRVLERIAALEGQYGQADPCQSLIEADQVYEIIDYMENGSFSMVQYFIRLLGETRYLHRLSRIVRSIPPSQWKDAFSLLWNDNPMVSDAFERLISLLSRLHFRQYVGIDVRPLLSIDGTILSVDRIKEFFGVDRGDDGSKIEAAAVPGMQVYAAGQVIEVKKSEFTSIAAEVILRVPEEVAASKPFMRTLDILDFPGARTRQNFPEAIISRKEVCTMLLRGRVGYLFNKYSRSYLISTLLFCHHQVQTDVPTLSGLLRNWISDMVGPTAEERARFMQDAEVPPLFIVSTKFNIDLTRVHSQEPPGASEEKLAYQANYRWELRYTKVLQELIMENRDNTWFSRWVPGSGFKNIYLLRDYTWTDGVFEGYLESGAETGYKPGMEEFEARLKDSFLRHDFVKAHFRNPAEAWERSATPGNDGSEYIIENLVKASRHVVQARDAMFERMVAGNFADMFGAMYAHYHDDNSDSMLARALESAGRIDLTLGILFGRKPYLFTSLLDSMLVSEENLHGRILDVAKEMKLIEKTDLTALFALRERAGIDPALGREENIARTIRAYYLKDRKELEEYLKGFGYTIDDLINPPMVQNLPQVLVDTLEQYWMSQYISTANLEKFTAEGVPGKALEEIASNLRVLYRDKLGITARIIERIQPFVTSPASVTAMAEMLADMVAEMFNKFVNSFGTAYFTPRMWKDLEQTVDRNGFGVEITPADFDAATLDEKATRAGMGEVFDVFENIDKILNQVPVPGDKLAYFSNYHNFRTWTHNLKMGFLSTCEIPKYDIHMNNALRTVILKDICRPAPLKGLVDADPEMHERVECMEHATID